MRPIVIDFETFFSTEFSLSKMSTEQYLRDPRFEAHGAAIKWSPSTSAQWYSRHDLNRVLAEEDWSDVFLIAHHMNFDGAILAWHYGVKPKMYGCTLSMGRLLLGNHLSVSLDSLRKEFGLPAKITPYHLFKGKHWNELSDDTRFQLGMGACDEVESIWQLFSQHLAPKFPAEEYDIIDMVIRMFVDPALQADIPMLIKVWQDENSRKKALMQQLGVTEAELQSADRFKTLLEAEGIEIEYKDGKKGKNPCFAKTDDFMRDLLEDPNERVRTLAEARLGVKSTILQTRAETLARMGSRGSLPVYLRYSGAGTLRVSGGDGANWLNFKRGSPIRRAICAPEGYVIAPVDASQIECVAHDQIVLTHNGPKAIQDVEITDRVWDGIEYVAHEGVVLKGTREVITYQGLTATPDHIVFVRSRGGEEKMEMQLAAALGRDLVTASPPTSVCQTPMRKSLVRGIQNLRRAWNKVQIQVCSRFRYMGSRKSTASRLHRSGNRPNRQRWALRAGEFATFNAAGECQQPIYDVLGADQMRTARNAGFQTSVSGMRVWSRSNQRISRKRFNRRGDNFSIQKYLQENDISETSIAGIGSGSGFEAEKETISKQKVYDIVNAGPRHRFVASGVLVSNCRVLHYLAGGPDEPVIQKFRNNEDPYVDLASHFYGERIYKPTKDDPRRMEMEAKRGMGKQGRLMCGYGSSGRMFKASAKNGLYGPPVDISIDDANRFVAMYRDTNPSICAKGSGYWAQAKRMLARLAGGEPMQWGPLWVENHRLYLPNGCPLIYDTLEYFTPSLDEIHNYKETEQNGFWRVRTKNGWKTMWGSKLVQNICEAVSRVIVSQAAIRIRRMGFRVLNWPYDELLILLPRDGHEEKNTERCIEEMTREVSWLPGLPLAAEGHPSDRYEK